MKCPECGKVFFGRNGICPKCGKDAAVKKEPGGESGSGEKLSLNKDSSDNNSQNDKYKKTTAKETRIIEVKAIETDSGSTPAVKRHISLKLIGIIAAAIAVIVLCIVIAVSVRSSKGERYAETAAGFIGKNVTDLNGSSEVYYSDNSAYAGVNSAVQYDYIAEAEKHIRAGGVKYPAWAVVIKTDRGGGFISDVVYTDFTVVKGDMRGIKTDGVISLDRFNEGEKKNTVLKAVKPRPYSISTSQTGIVVYTYKYWYKLDNGDEQGAILRVAFSEKGDYKYSTTELLVPQYM